MSKIRILADRVANQIAAGEWLGASVVKNCSKTAWMLVLQRLKLNFEMEENHILGLKIMVRVCPRMRHCCVWSGMQQVNQGGKRFKSCKDIRVSG